MFAYAVAVTLAAVVLLGTVVWQRGRVLRAEVELVAERRAQERMGDRFAVLSEAALDRVVARQGASAAADLDSRRASVEALVAPVRETLGAVADQLRAIELGREAAQASLVTQLRGLGEAQDRLRAETATLAAALRSPTARGRWGEVQLRRVIELAGMVEHCDFVTQVSADGDGVVEGRLRPDVVVRLPGGTSIVIDAKVPLSAYLSALERGSDERAAASDLAAHARALRGHVDALAAKSYWDRFAPSPELVVLFVPGESLLAAALDADPGLHDHALGRSVLLATPTSLIGLLKAVAFGWRQEALADSAREVCDLGRTLHARLTKLVGHVDRLGRALDTAVGAYNDAVGSLESRVLVSARRLAELRMADGKLTSPRQVETGARRVAAAVAAEPGRLNIEPDRVTG